MTSLSCFTTTNRFDLVLTPLPFIDEPVITFEQCDETDGNSDGIVLTNLRSFENLISTNSSNEVFTYYTSSTRSPGSKINDPASYYNTDINGNPIPNDIVYVQINSILPNNVFAPNGSCVRDAEIRRRKAEQRMQEEWEKQAKSEVGHDRFNSLRLTWNEWNGLRELSIAVDGSTAKRPAWKRLLKSAIDSSNADSRRRSENPSDQGGRSKYVDPRIE